MPSHALRTPVSAVPDLSAAEVDLGVAPASDENVAAPARRRRSFSALLALLAVLAAFVSLGACTNAGNGTKGSQIVWLARTHIGAPYVYGAAGPNSFDCSGLVQYVHSQAGISIPRTTESQLAAARPVSKSSAQPGDVIFFGNYHVGIYVGGGQIIDAPHTGATVTQRAIWTSAYTVGRFD